MSTVEQDGAIHVEGEYVGHMKGFHFIPDGASSMALERTLEGGIAARRSPRKFRPAPKQSPPLPTPT